MKINYKNLILILKNYEVAKSIDLAVEKLYNKQIFTYLRNGKQQTGVATIKQYVKACVQLGFITETSEITQLGENLIKNIESPQYNDILITALTNVEGIKELISQIKNMDDAPIRDNIYYQLNQKVKISKSTLKSLLSLLEGTNIVSSNKKTTYYPIDLDYLIVKANNSKKSTYQKLISEFKSQGYSSTEIEISIHKLLLQKKIVARMNVPMQMRDIYQIIWNYKKVPSLPMKIRMDNKFKKYLVSHSLDIDALQKEFSEFLSFSPTNSKEAKGILVIQNLLKADSEIGGI